MTKVQLQYHKKLRFLVFGEISEADALPSVAISHKLSSDSIGDYQNHHQLASYRVITAIVLSLLSGRLVLIGNN